MKDNNISRSHSKRYPTHPKQSDYQKLKFSNKNLVNTIFINILGKKYNKLLSTQQLMSIKNMSDKKNLKANSTINVTEIS